jgi:kynurenine 3-monooxygenase
MASMDGQKVIIVGVGPVGALAALYAATRGALVEIYELRSDLRHQETTPLNFTKSINLALSERGINAFRSHGDFQLLERILARTIPMNGRMIHTRSKTGRIEQQSQAYDVHGRFQRSVDRGELNKALLDQLDTLPNVKFFYQHKLTGADFKRNKAWFEIMDGKHSPSSGRAREIEVSFDLCIGADGAHSATRFHMMKFARMDFEQKYIDCLWCEFTMPPDPSTKDFAISPNHLHIWPAGSFMFIALPNLDKSFTCTLFAPNSFFNTLDSAAESTFLSIFYKHFPGVTSYIPPADLVSQFHRNPHLPLINIKASPHHYSSSVVILGDAANAMVPFYGQGMNAGLESIHVLFSKLDSISDRSQALESYTTERVQDAHVIADLALANYTEMSSGVTSRAYKLRKRIEETLDKYFPSLGWATQYSRISFSNLRYSEVIQRSESQRLILAVLAGIGGSAVLTPLVLMAVKLAMGGKRTPPIMWPRVNVPFWRR